MMMHQGVGLLNRGFGPDGPSDFWVLVSWHPPSSVTWRWALYWWPPRQRRWWFEAQRQRHNYGGHAWLAIPLLGTLSLAWQNAIPRDGER